MNVQDKQVRDENDRLKQENRELRAEIEALLSDLQGAYVHSAA